MSYRNGHFPQSNGHRKTVNANGLQTVYVHLTPQFVESWGGGRYSNDVGSLTQHFGRELRLGYLETDENNRNPRLRFPERNVVIPLHSRGSMANVQASGFYHEGRIFQLGRKKMEPASIDGKSIKPGVVRVWWDVMY
ncbi:MAG: hypothetical protein HY516_03670 [Candidatus Aenigmarchaeota archaeon]|nr:hypothetical protein [Candidatus Aenigmarchaeota archaeon]